MNGSCPHCSHIGSFTPTSDTIGSVAAGLWAVVSNPVKAVVDDARSGGAGCSLGTCPSCSSTVMECHYCQTVQERAFSVVNCIKCKKLIISS
jgi:hypothetical protein